MAQTQPGCAIDGHALLKRLRRVEDQVRGLQRMVDEEACCIDILTQVSAREETRESAR